MLQALVDFFTRKGKRYENSLVIMRNDLLRDCC